MLIDARELDSGSMIESDVCVIGGGAAGITIARELAASGHSVSLLEGGGLEYDQLSQALYGGQESGTLIRPESFYLSSTRLRYLGGSTNHWEGFCRPMDPEDFSARSWVDARPWPFDLEELRPYYDRAAEPLQITPFDYDPSSAGDQPHLLAGDDGFETVFFHISPPTRFGQTYREELESSQQVRVLINANVTQIEVDGNAGHVTGIEVLTGPGERLRVRAGQYVLACGAIENARLLLASNRVQRVGLGNDHDLVGRFYMDHPFLRIGYVVIPFWRHLMSNYSASRVRARGHRIRGVLRPKAEFQERHELLNSLIIFEPLKSIQMPQLVRDVGLLATDVVRLEGDVPPPEPSTTYYGWVVIQTEQTPNADSRVGLSGELDRLGVPRPKLEWQLSDQDAASMRATVEHLAGRLGSRLRGRIKMLVDADNPWGDAQSADHHMGSTRMDSSPSQGVVDENLRLHGVDNLYVAGSSVFPTGGAANPTHTLVALALRLSDHLKGALESS